MSEHTVSLTATESVHIRQLLRAHRALVSADQLMNPGVRERVSAFDSDLIDKLTSAYGPA